MSAIFFVVQNSYAIRITRNIRVTHTCMYDIIVNVEHHVLMLDFATVGAATTSFRFMLFVCLLYAFDFNVFFARSHKGKITILFIAVWHL